MEIEVAKFLSTQFKIQINRDKKMSLKSLKSQDRFKLKRENICTYEETELNLK